MLNAFLGKTCSAQTIMFYTAFIVLLATVGTIYVQADPTPTAPGPGAVFIEGQTCSTSWQVDPSGLWKTMVIDLMTGDNYHMVHLASGLIFLVFSTASE